MMEAHLVVVAGEGEGAMHPMWAYVNDLMNRHPRPMAEG